MIRTHVSRVTPDWDLLKDALTTELQRRDAMGKKVEKCFHQVNLVSEKFAARVIFFRLLQTLR